jgi:hypothetical protein
MMVQWFVEALPLRYITVILPLLKYTNIQGYLLMLLAADSCALSFYKKRPFV